jgi:hypothetical protein
MVDESLDGRTSARQYGFAADLQFLDDVAHGATREQFGALVRLAAPAPRQTVGRQREDKDQFAIGEPTPCKDLDAEVGKFADDNGRACS